MGDAAPLMRGAAALINLSCFESWSTTAEEAKARGTPMILSDHGVHREQAEENAHYFGPMKPDELADRLVGFILPSPATRAQVAAVAAERSVLDTGTFATAFVDLADAVIARDVSVRATTRTGGRRR